MSTGFESSRRTIAIAVHGVRQEQDSLGRYVVVRHEGVCDQPGGALDALIRIAEYARLDREKDSVAWGNLADESAGSRMAAAEVVEMAATAGAIQILVSSSTKAVHDVEGASADRVRTRARCCPSAGPRRPSSIRTPSRPSA